MTASTVDNASLVTISAISGMALYDRDGHKLGSIKDIYVDRLSGRIEFILGASGGLLGVGEKFHPMPWSWLTYRADPQGYVTGFTKAELQAAPAYDREQLASAHYGWSDQVATYFDKLRRTPGL